MSQFVYLYLTFINAILRFYDKKISHIVIFFLGLAYREFLRELQLSCTTDLEYHELKDNRAFSPRRPDYNRLYASYCKERYGARNGSEMFSALSEDIETYLKNNPGAIITFQEYQENEDSICPDLSVHIDRFNTPYESCPSNGKHIKVCVFLL